MEQNINIAALLKDCSKGTKLYSPWCGNCQFQFINPRGQIVVFADEMNDREIPIAFEEKGNQFQTGECLLFPSKDNRDWSTFKAPQKEQQKFKVGDVVKVHNQKGLEIGIYLGGDYKDALVNAFYKDSISFADDYATIEHLATPEEIAKWNKETLEPNHLHYSKSKRKIIDWFNHKDDVVVRFLNKNGTVWKYDIFSHYDKDDMKHYHCVGGHCEVCLPYNEKTAKLIGTTDDWKEE